MPNRLVFIDIKTTGMTLRGGHRIISIAAIEVSPKNKVLASHHSYINPTIALTPKVLEELDLTVDFLTGKPSFAKIAPAFIEFIKDAILVFYNAPFGRRFINRELGLLRLGNIADHCKHTLSLHEMASSKLPPQAIRNRLVANEAVDQRIVKQIHCYTLDTLLQFFEIDPKIQYHSNPRLNECYLLRKLYHQLLQQPRLAIKRARAEDGQTTANPASPTQLIGYDVNYRVMHNLHLRVDHGDFFLGANNQILPIKTAILINTDKLPLNNAKALEKKFSDISTHRPVAEILEVTAPGSPVMVRTPRQSRLKRVAKFGAFSIFSNSPHQTQVKDTPGVKEDKIKTEFFSSTQYQAVKKFRNAIKRSEIIITPALLKKTHHDYEKNGFIRKVSQQQAMKNKDSLTSDANAKDYADATGLFPDMRWEWLHLIAYMILGEESQTADNLVAGTADSNTEMMFPEVMMNYLCKEYPAGFTLQIKASMIRGTQIAKSIEYTLITDDFTFPLTFDAQTPNKPHLNYFHYFLITMEALITQAKEVERSPDKRKKSKDDGENSTHQLFYKNTPS